MNIQHIYNNSELLYSNFDCVEVSEIINTNTFDLTESMCIEYLTQLIDNFNKILFTDENILIYVKLSTFYMLKNSDDFIFDSSDAIFDCVSVFSA